MNDLKFVYLKDPIDERRVLTIGYCVYDTYGALDNCIKYYYAINKVVDKEVYTIDGRLKEFLGSTCFKEVQKRFKKRYGGDQHNKKIAKAKIRGGFKYRKYFVIEYRNREIDPLHFILWNLSNKLIGNGYVGRIAEYYYRSRIVENVTDEVKSNISGGWTSVGEKI